MKQRKNVIVETERERTKHGGSTEGGEGEDREVERKETHIANNTGEIKSRAGTQSQSQPRLLPSLSLRENKSGNKMTGSQKSSSKSHPFATMEMGIRVVLAAGERMEVISIF